MDLHNESFKPFRKPNDTPIYVHKLSNHPSHVSKNLPKAINRRINQLSSTEQIFNNSKHDYEVALKKRTPPKPHLSTKYTLKSKCQ